MYKILAKLGSKVRVITSADTTRRKKERIGKIILATESFIVVKYARGYREYFGLADVIAPNGTKLLAWNGEEWSEIEYEHRRKY